MNIIVRWSQSDIESSSAMTVLVVCFRQIRHYDDFADDDKYRKSGSIWTLFKEFDRDYYKPIRTDDGFAGRRNNYIEYKSKGDRYENLSPEEYLDMIRPYFRDLINNHKPTTESNNEGNNEENDRAEWKIHLVMENNCISVKILKILAPYIQQVNL